MSTPLNMVLRVTVLAVTSWNQTLKSVHTIVKDGENIYGKRGGICMSGSKGYKGTSLYFYSILL